MPSKSDVLKLLGSITLSGLLFLTPIHAQDAEDGDSRDEPIYELTPFTVNTQEDVGYLATNSNSGTRLNAKIKDIPIALEVITSEFIEDTGATDFKESLNYSAGIFTETYVNNTGANLANGDRSPSSSANVGDRRTNAIIIRGFNAPFQQRMGFRIGSYIGIRGASTGQGSTGRGGLTLGSLVDAVNMNRNEVVRGPGALLYGLGVISGIVNVMPNRPLPEQQVKVTFGVGNFDYMRGSLDVTGPILKDKDGGSYLNYRIMGSWTQEGDETDYFLEERDYLAAQLEWIPTQGMRIFGEYQQGTTRFEGHLAQTIRIGVDGWQDPYGRGFSNEYGENNQWGVDDFTGRYPDIWDADNWPEIWENPPDPSLADDFAPLDGNFLDPATTRITGPDTWYERDEWSGILNWEYALNEHIAFNVGGFITQQDNEEFEVNVEGITTTYYLLSLRDNHYEYERVPEEFVWPVLNPTGAANRSNQIYYMGVGSYWTKVPSWASSGQIRAEVNFNFETDFLFKTKAEHSILLGRHDIEDQADVPLGTEPRNQVMPDSVFQPATELQLGVNEDGDAFTLHNFHDWTQPIRYNGTPLVRPADEYITTKLFYSGYYAVYHGKLFDERMDVIAGYRMDSYNAKEERWDREDFDITNKRIGTIEEYHNFPEDIEISTGSFGINYKLTEALSMYAVYSEGVIPNTGLRDGAGIPIQPEQTASREIGFKFDFWEGKVSGTISFFEIDRRNAVWSYGNAPAPGRWVGGLNPFVGNDSAFDPEILVDGAPVNYGISYDLYLRPLVESTEIMPETGTTVGEHWREKLGITRNPFFGSLDVPQNSATLQNGEMVGNPAPGIVSFLHENSLNLRLDQVEDYNRPYVFIAYDQLAQDSELKSVMDQAFSDYQTGNHPSYIAPFSWGGGGSGDISGANASRNNGGNVTFREEAIGVDGQIVFTPNRNWQIVFTFAHVEREATSSFNLVRAYDHRFPEFGDFGTEYDVWVADVGAENFEDPTDPTTMKGGIQGMSLYYGSEDNANLWARYTFREGPLENFGFGLGVRYAGPAQTFIPIGGNLAVNRYPTPPTDDFYQLDAAIYYKKSFKRFDLNVRFNIYNLFDDDELYTEANYANVDYPDLTETRRTIRYRTPLYYRLTVGMTF